MSADVIIDGQRLRLQDGDSVEIQRNYCGKCGCDHSELTVYRNRKDITHLGDELTLEGKDEIYGGVVIDKDGNVLPDPHWVVHLLYKDVKKCMTDDQYYYIGMCGEVLDHRESNKHDRISFHPHEIRGKEKAWRSLKKKRRS